MEDEAIDSFLSRARHIMPEKFGASGSWRDLHGRDTDSLKQIAAKLGWTGCFGFNKLLALHTNHTLGWIVHDPLDPSFSQDLCHRTVAIKNWNERDLALCYGCIAEDQDKLGFIYWRRSHQGDVTVCARHQLKLVNRCFSCGSAYNFGFGKYRNWAPCDCAEWISKDEATLPGSEYELKNAKLRESISRFSFQIPQDYIINTIGRRNVEMRNSLESWTDQVSTLRGGGSECCALSSFMIELSDMQSWDGASLLRSIPLECLIDIMFSSFSEFLKSVGCPAEELIPVASKWATYKTEHGFVDEINEEIFNWNLSSHAWFNDEAT